MAKKEFNSLVVTYNPKKVQAAKAILNGEDVSSDTHLIELTPIEARIHLIKRPTRVENGELAVNVVVLDEIKVN